MTQIILEMRLKQWTKNFFVYAALLFNGSLFSQEKLFPATITFFAFCLLSSSVYFFNDIFDYEVDRANPEKSSRPIAAGTISLRMGYCCATILFLTAMFLSYLVNLDCVLLLLSYAILNILYTVKLKHVVIIDVIIIAYGFVSRALAGAFATSISLTEWFILCVMFLSMFLALGKRRYELVQSRDGEGRKVLKSYNLNLIDQMITIILSALIMCYALFAIDVSTKDSREMTLTIPLVIYGIFYYLYVIHVKGKGGEPDKLLYKEKPILIVVLIYVAVIIFSRNI